ncbi:MAG: hypothetical protein GY774_15170 [Planctomycetes bacterium]|nr:hypothetical protein [Planctomycetota bacterium]
MIENKKQSDKKKTTIPKRTLKRILFVAIVLVIAAFIYCFFCYVRQSQSADEELAAIMAARAIPDSQNAAILYDQLLKDVNTTSLYDQIESIDHDNIELIQNQTRPEKDYPEYVTWIKECQWLIDELHMVEQFEKCLFPIEIEFGPVRMNRINKMLLWMFMFKHASNQDVVQGKVDDAISKWRCLIQIGKHLQQQPQRPEFLIGISLESMAIHEASNFLVKVEVNEHCLQKIASIPLETRDNWAFILDKMLPVEKLAELKFKEQLSLIRKLKYELGYGRLGGMRDPRYERTHWTYSGLLASRRGLHILVALRRYRNEHGCWPDSLDEIRSHLPVEILLDPFYKDEFAYKLTDEGFTLYSRGENGIDEGGQRDYIRALDKHEDDIAIWPLQKQ